MNGKNTCIAPRIMNYIYIYDYYYYAIHSRHNHYYYYDYIVTYVDKKRKKYTFIIIEYKW